jgi:hypothetical protein
MALFCSFVVFNISLTTIWNLFSSNAAVGEVEAEMGGYGSPGKRVACPPPQWWAKLQLLLYKLK